MTRHHRAWELVPYTDNTFFIGELRDGKEHTGCFVDADGVAHMTMFVGGKSYDLQSVDHEFCAAQSAARRAYKRCRSSCPPGMALASVDLDAVGREPGQAERFCICRGRNHGFMLGCVCCDGWFHGKCVGISKNEVSEAHDFVCPNCNMKNPGHATLTIAQEQQSEH